MASFKSEKFDLLVALYIFCIAISELMGSKTFFLTQIGDFKLNASVAIFVIPLLFSINDIIVETHGKERARSVVRSGLMVVFLIAVFTVLATKLPPSARFAPSEAAYDSIFAKSTRIAIASLVAFGLSEFLDVYLFSRLRELMGKQALWFRNNASNFVAQFVDTVVFIGLAFYDLSHPFGGNLSFLFSIILPYWLLKCGLSVIETPLVYLGVRWLKNDKQA